jgi:hypothetical protein
VLVTDPDEYEEVFGGFTRESELATAVVGFFENGGTQLWVARTTHFADPSDPETTAARRAFAVLTSPGASTHARVIGGVGPFRLSPGDELAVSIDGAAEDVVVFDAGAASSPSTGAAPFALADGDTLTLRFDDGEEQGVVFDAADFGDIRAASALEVAAAINAQVRGGKVAVAGGALVLRSDLEGLDSAVEVTGGPAAAALGFAVARARGTGNVADVRAVTIEEIAEAAHAVATTLVVEADTSGALVLRTARAGESSTIQIGARTAAVFGLDGDLHRGSEVGALPTLRIEGKDPGAYANSLDVVVRAATDGFDLLVMREGTVRERFPGVSMDPSGVRYVERVVNDARSGSALVRVIDLHASGSPMPTPSTVRLVGGDDGLTGLGDADFIGAEAGKTGLRALDRVLDLAILFVPGRATPAVHQAMVQYCEIERRGSVFPVLDPPAGMSAIEIRDYVSTTSGLLNLSEFGAIYWPRVRVRNPNRTVFGPDETIVVPPSGIICGVYARSDAARLGGVYDPPAGVEVGRMFGVLGFETDECLEESKRDIVFPKRINPLTTEPGFPRYIDGARTLKGDGNFPSVSQRRGVTFIERSLKRGLQFVRHRNPTDDLLSEVDSTARAFLLEQTERNAFASRDPEEAFFLDVTQRLVSVPDGIAALVELRIGLATMQPAEFVLITVSQLTRAVPAAAES